MFWSGGKDSSLALYEILINRPDLEVCYLVTTINAGFQRISMHGVREELLERQAEAIGIPLLKMHVPNIPTNDVYEQQLHLTLSSLKTEGISHVIYGDIFLEDLKQYRINILNQYGLTGIFPLWGYSTDLLICKFIDLKFRTITCCISTYHLTENWVGKEIDVQFIKNLPANVDPCGENGEFHTFCFEGPIFKSPVTFSLGEKKYVPLQIKTVEGTQETGFWYIDLM